ncbi:MAG TPA: hypothetical protein PK323_07750 [Bacteroidia bacterium]|nr:hypothetical protein [Bacteroidia bacterium]
MRYFVFCLISFFSTEFVNAQTDTISVFRKSNTLPKKKDEFRKYTNSIHFNLLQLLRGGVLFDYEKVFENLNFAVGAGIGFSKYDALGQIYFRELAPYYKYNASNISKIDTKIRPIYDFNIKYYINEDDFQFYTGAGYARIANTVITDILKFGQNYTSSNSKIDELIYISNEIKFVIGITNLSNRRFYHDFCLGPGYRMIKYESLKYVLITNSVNGSTYNYEIDKEFRNNQTIWFYFAWRMGIRF